MSASRRDLQISVPGGGFRDDFERVWTNKKENKKIVHNDGVIYEHEQHIKLYSRACAHGANIIENSDIRTI